MDLTFLVVLSVVAGVAVSIGVLILRRSMSADRLCVHCERVTRHRRDYGAGPVLSYVVASVMLGQQSMTDQYYPFRCGICGLAHQGRAAEVKAHELKLDITPQDGALGNWEATGGVQKWSALKWNQKLLLIVMIGIGLVLTVLYFMSRRK
jgi:hypothetical protein